MDERLQSHQSVDGPLAMDARGLKAEELVEGSSRSTLDELTELTAAAEKVLVF